jgi:hypothetical protein
MNDLLYIFGSDPADRPEAISPCLASKIITENAKLLDGARIWWSNAADDIWEDTLRHWAQEPYLWAEKEDAAEAEIFNELPLSKQRDLVRRSRRSFPPTYTSSSATPGLPALATASGFWLFLFILSRISR